MSNQTSWQERKENQTDFGKWDIPESVRKVIDRAVEIKLIGVVDIYALAIEHGTDWLGLVDSLIDTAFAQRHTDHSLHVEIVETAKAFYSARWDGKIS